MGRRFKCPRQREDLSRKHLSRYPATPSFLNIHPPCPYQRVIKAAQLRPAQIADDSGRAAGACSVRWQAREVRAMSQIAWGFGRPGGRSKDRADVSHYKLLTICNLSLDMRLVTI